MFACEPHHVNYEGIILVTRGAICQRFLPRGHNKFDHVVNNNEDKLAPASQNRPRRSRPRGFGSPKTGGLL